jgi:hypothetical protein
MTAPIAAGEAHAAAATPARALAAGDQRRTTAHLVGVLV